MDAGMQAGTRQVLGRTRALISQHWARCNYAPMQSNTHPSARGFTILRHA